MSFLKVLFGNSNLDDINQDVPLSIHQHERDQGSEEDREAENQAKIKQIKQDKQNQE